MPVRRRGFFFPSLRVLKKFCNFMELKIYSRTFAIEYKLPKIAFVISEGLK